MINVHSLPAVIQQVKGGNLSAIKDLKELLTTQVDLMAAIKQYGKSKYAVPYNNFKNIIFACRELIKDKNINKDIQDKVEQLLQGVVQDCNKKEIPLIFATTSFDDIAFAKILVELKADPNICDEKGNSAIIAALSFKLGPDKLKFYLEVAKVNPFILTQIGNSCLSYCEVQNIFDVNIINSLIDARAAWAREHPEDPVMRSADRYKFIKDAGHILGLSTEIALVTERGTKKTKELVTTEESHTIDSLLTMQEITDDFLAKEKAAVTVTQAQQGQDKSREGDYFSKIQKAVKNAVKEVTFSSYGNEPSTLRLSEKYKLPAKNDEEFFLMPLGFESDIEGMHQNHAMTVTFYKDYIIVSDRGGIRESGLDAQYPHLKEGKNVAIYHIQDRSKITPDFIKNLKKANALSKVLELLKTNNITLEKTLPAKGQSHGTCSFVNIKSAIIGMNYLQKLEDCNDPAQAEEYAKKAYKKFTNSIRNSFVEKMTKRYQNAVISNNQVEKDLYLETFNAVLIEHHGQTKKGAKHDRKKKVEQEINRAALILNVISPNDLKKMEKFLSTISVPELSQIAAKSVNVTLKAIALEREKKAANFAELWKAVEERNIQELQRILATEFFKDKNLLNSEDFKKNGMTALGAAIEQGFFDVADVLLENGADPRIKSSSFANFMWPMDCIEYAIVKAKLGRNISTLEYILSNDKFKPYQKNLKERLLNPEFFIEQIYSNRLDFVRLLLNSGVDPTLKTANASDESAFAVVEKNKQRNPEMFVLVRDAVQASYEKQKADLVPIAEGNINAEKIKIFQQTFMNSFQDRNLPMLQFLLGNPVIKQAIDLNPNLEGQKTPLMLAIENNQLEIAKMLINAGAKCSGGFNPLTYAVQHKKDAAVRLLMNEMGMDPTTQDANGNTAVSIFMRDNIIQLRDQLQNSVEKQYEKDKKECLEMAAGPNAAQNLQKMLFKAINNNHEKLINFLVVEVGVNPYQKDSHGNSAYILVVKPNVAGNAVSNALPAAQQRLLNIFKESPYAKDWYKTQAKAENAIKDIEAYLPKLQGKTTLKMFYKEKFEDKLTTSRDLKLILSDIQKLPPQDLEASKQILLNKLESVIKQHDEARAKRGANDKDPGGLAKIVAKIKEDFQLGLQVPSQKSKLGG